MGRAECHNPCQVPKWFHTNAAAAAAAAFKCGELYCWTGVNHDTEPTWGSVVRPVTDGAPTPGYHAAYVLDTVLLGTSCDGNRKVLLPRVRLLKWIRLFLSGEHPRQAHPEID